MQDGTPVPSPKYGCKFRMGGSDGWDGGSNGMGGKTDWAGDVEGAVLGEVARGFVYWIRSVGMMC